MKKKINEEMIDKIMTSESLKNLVKATAASIEKRVKSGVKFEQAKKEVFEEFDSIMNIVKKLSLDRYNSRAFLDEDQDKWLGSIIEPYIIVIALMGGILVLVSIIVKFWRG
jgi:hypothetical protein